MWRFANIQISMKIHLVVGNNKKRKKTCRLVYLVVPAGHRLKIQGNKESDKY